MLLPTLVIVGLVALCGMAVLDLVAWHWPLPDLQSALVLLVSFGALWSMANGRLTWTARPERGRSLPDGE